MVGQRLSQPQMPVVGTFLRRREIRAMRAAPPYLPLFTRAPAASVPADLPDQTASKLPEVSAPTVVVRHDAPDGQPVVAPVAVVPKVCTTNRPYVNVPLVGLGCATCSAAPRSRRGHGGQHITAAAGPLPQVS